MTMGNQEGVDTGDLFVSRIPCGDMTVLYPRDEVSGHVGLWLIPGDMEDRMVSRRAYLDGIEIRRLPWPPPRAWAVEPLVQLALAGDGGAAGFAQGRTMRDASATVRLTYEGQEVIREDGRTVVVTRLGSADGYRCEHLLTYHHGDAALRVRACFTNTSDHPLTLEMLSSFSLGGITPFASDDAPGRLVAHRLRSGWSAEARLVSEPVERLGLERSWTGSAAFCERFGQVGTMPVRGYAPVVAVEDTAAGVLWGAHLAWAGSWQLEIYRKDDLLSLSGGLADYEFGHWRATVAPGARVTSPEAVLSVTHGDLDLLCHRLTGAQRRAADEAPAIEADLPIQFNEYCTTWGKPSRDVVLALADRLEETSATYLVIDAGWYADENGDWARGHGDWIPNARLFPDGLAATARAIRARGLIPGLWFEIETCGRDAIAYALTDHLLQRDGAPITVGDRRFWDMRDPFVVDYLSERVIGLLTRCGFGYLKVDYNETLGVGCDGAVSPGEGLRQQVEGVYAFFRRIRERLPDLVIENCASGGHRLEPSLMALSSLGSFSDAHETHAIPIIAANLHRLILPRQSLVWAVLRRDDDERRLIYSLAATFLGRMCLSGDALELDDVRWALATRAMDLYRSVWPVIKHGRSRRFGPDSASYRQPRGWQAMLRTSDDGTRALAVMHAFADPPPDGITVALPPAARGARWRLTDSFQSGDARPRVVDDLLHWRPDGAFSGAVAHLAARPTSSSRSRGI